MVTLPEATWRTRPGLAQLVDVLGGGTSVRLVGGAVRDGLLNLPVNDIDMATIFSPDEIVRRLTAAGIKAVPTGLAHGTITAVTEGGPVEVTTLRRDVATDGRHAVVAFTDDWREDAARRDFTINALYADATTGEIFDWFDGIADLTARRVRYIGDPLKRIAEDHLRILRFFRFHARFGVGPPDAEGLAACAARARDLMTLSRERIAAELMKLLASANPAPAITTMLDGAILGPVLPEIDDAGRDRLVRVVANEAATHLAPDAVRRLIALLPDDAAAADDIVVRLKLPNAVRKRVAAIRRRTTVDPARIRQVAYQLGVTGAIDALLLSDSGTDAIANALSELREWEVPRLPVSGGDLIAGGLVPGPIVAKTLAAIERRWIEQDFPTGTAFRTIVDAAISSATC